MDVAFLPVRQEHPWRQIVALAVPNVASSLAMYSTVVITTLCISHEDQPSLLAAFGLGSLISNVLGLSIGVGLTSVLETLVSQAYGAGNSHLTAVHLNRARLVVTLILIPCCVNLYYTEYFLLLLQQDPTVAALAGEYTRSYMWGLLPFFYLCCTASFLRSCQRPNPPLISNIVGSLIHLCLSIYLINVLKMGMRGAGIAMALNSFFRFSFLESYLLCNPELNGHKYTSEIWSLKGIRHFLGLGIPSFLLVAVEWSAFELQSVLAGWVSTDGLAAHIAGINVIAILFMIPSGLSQSLSSLIGARLGEGMPNLALDITKKGALLMLSVSCAYGVCIFYLQDSIVRLYSTDEKMSKIFKSLLTIISFFVVGDAMTTTLTGSIRGLGLQTIAAKYQMLAMFGIMLPIGFVSYPYLGVPGVWLGSVAGITTSALLFLNLIRKTDFSEFSRRAISEATRLAVSSP